MFEKPLYWWKLFEGEAFHVHGFEQTLNGCLETSRSILDLGCGDNTALDVHRTSEREVWGTDFQQHPDLSHPETFRLMPADGTIPFEDARFDVVTARWVLEHVEHPSRFLSEVERVLRPGGVFVGHSINSAHYVAGIRRALDIVPHSVTQWLVRKLYGRPDHDTFPTFYRLNSERVLRSRALESGLRLEEWQTYTDQSYFTFHPLAYHLAMVADSLLESLFDDVGRIYFTVVLRKPDHPAARLAA